MSHVDDLMIELLSHVSVANRTRFRLHTIHCLEQPSQMDTMVEVGAAGCVIDRSRKRIFISEIRLVNCCKQVILVKRA